MRTPAEGHAADHCVHCPYVQTPSLLQQTPVLHVSLYVSDSVSATDTPATTLPGQVVAPLQLPGEQVRVRVRVPTSQATLQLDNGDHSPQVALSGQQPALHGSAFVLFPVQLAPHPGRHVLVAVAVPMPQEALQSPTTHSDHAGPQGETEKSRPSPPRARVPFG